MSSTTPLQDASISAPIASPAAAGTPVTNPSSPVVASATAASSAPAGPVQQSSFLAGLSPLVRAAVELSEMGIQLPGATPHSESSDLNMMSGLGADSFAPASGSLAGARASAASASDSPSAQQSRGAGSAAQAGSRRIYVPRRAGGSSAAAASAAAAPSAQGNPAASNGKPETKSGSDKSPPAKGKEGQNGKGGSTALTPLELETLRNRHILGSFEDQLQMAKAMSESLSAAANSSSSSAALGGSDSAPQSASAPAFASLSASASASASGSASASATPSAASAPQSKAATELEALNTMLRATPFTEITRLRNEREIRIKQIGRELKQLEAAQAKLRHSPSEDPAAASIINETRLKSLQEEQEKLAREVQEITQYLNRETEPKKRREEDRSSRGLLLSGGPKAAGRSGTGSASVAAAARSDADESLDAILANLHSVTDDFFNAYNPPSPIQTGAAALAAVAAAAAATHGLLGGGASASEGKEQKARGTDQKSNRLGQPAPAAAEPLSRAKVLQSRYHKRR